MRRLALIAMLAIAGCAGNNDLVLRPLPAATEPSTDVTVIRPRSVIQAEWPFYIVVAGQPVFDLRNGERTRFRHSPGLQTLTIRCLSAISNPVDSRIDYDFPPGGSAYFIVEPRGECASIRAVDARGAADDLATTRFRAVGVLNPAAQATGDAPAVISSQPAPPPPPVVSGPAAASAAWIEAFNSRDVARMASLYDADAVLRDASGQRIAAGPGGIAGYFSGLKTPATASLGEQDIRTFGDTAVATGVSTLGRHNIVYRNRGGKWLIVDHSLTAVK